MDDMSAKGPKGIEDAFDGRHNGACPGEYFIVAALDLAEAARVNKVPLDVDDDQGRCRQGKLKGIRPGIG
jgi:hypothetical protein